MEGLSLSADPWVKESCREASTTRNSHASRGHRQASGSTSLAIAEARRDLVADDIDAFAEEFPYPAEVTVELRKINYDYTQEFKFGLDLILDGIERMRDGQFPPQERKPRAAKKR
jgi:hypothetical protein